MNVSRRMYNGAVNPYEKINTQVIYATSAGTKSSYAYEALIDTFIKAIIDPKSAFCIGLDYRVPMKHNLIKMDDKSTICIINVLIDNNFYKQLKNVQGIEIYINNKSDKNFKKYKWIGLKNFYLQNFVNNSDKIDDIQFSCLINEKGIYDMNQISLNIHLSL